MSGGLMQDTPIAETNSCDVIQLILFIDGRRQAELQYQDVEAALMALAPPECYALKVVPVADQPHLVEHFRLVTTPALVKISPAPHQILAGSTLVEQLQHWWPYWQFPESIDRPIPEGTGAVAATASTTPLNLLELADDVFRLEGDCDRLREQLRFKDRIIAMLAHDLRNPLTAASLAIETLEINYRSDENRLSKPMSRQIVHQARAQLKEIDRMVTDLLQAARGTSSELQIYPQKLALAPLCLDVIEQFSDQINGKALICETDIPNDLPAVCADRERIRQVLVNLIDNAVKYSYPKGKLGIYVLHRTTQKIQVTIADQGPGIPLENQLTIFEDSFRLPRDRESDGYGIGLSVCQRIIRAHYGQIWVDSTDREGSLFHFTLPVYTQ
jgi:two-component system, OmpR family, clock-associated histidine kinase SasA